MRALVRTTSSKTAQYFESRGVELASGSLGDTDSLAAVMRRISSAFASTTPVESGTTAEINQGRATQVAAETAGLLHLVFSSVAGATQDSGVPHFESKEVIEHELGQDDAPFTILELSSTEVVTASLRPLHLGKKVTD